MTDCFAHVVSHNWLDFLSHWMWDRKIDWTGYSTEGFLGHIIMPGAIDS